MLFFSPHCFHHMFVFCTVTFTDCVYLYDFAIDKIASWDLQRRTFARITSRLAVKGLHRKTFFKMGRRTKSLRSPGLLSRRIAGSNKFFQENVAFDFILCCYLRTCKVEYKSGEHLVAQLRRTRYAVPGEYSIPHLAGIHANHPPNHFFATARSKDTFFGIWASFSCKNC